VTKNPRTQARSRTCTRSASLFAAAAAAFLLAHALSLRAQDNPKFIIDEDCQAFDVAPDNSIVYAVPHMKRVKKLIIERDDISIATGPGKIKRIVDPDKFMPIPPPNGYIVNALAWSPDSQHIAADLTLQEAPAGYEDAIKNKKDNIAKHDPDEDEAPLMGVGGGRAIALLDDDGREIKVEGSKTRFIQGGFYATWLADNATVVYLTGGGPYSIARVRPADGKTTTLFEGHSFSTVVWDAKNNRAFAVGDSLSLHSRLTLVQLDLVRETVTEIAQLDTFQGALSLSPSGTKIGFFEDGDTIDIVDITHPGKPPLRVRAGFGRFGWSRDERRILLKRGPDDRSNILLWVGLYDGTFSSILHDLEYRDFEISPDGESIAVTEPGKRELKFYPLQ